MTQQELTRRKVTIYALIGVGFAGLIGAHEVGSATASPDDTSILTVPFNSRRGRHVKFPRRRIDGAQAHQGAGVEIAATLT